MTQKLRSRLPTRDAGLIPGPGTEIPHAMAQRAPEPERHN